MCDAAWCAHVPERLCGMACLQRGAITSVQVLPFLSRLLSCMHDLTTHLVSMPVYVYIQGINIGIYNPTFPSIEVMTLSNTAQMSTTVIWIGLASGIGVLAFGCLFDQTSGIQLLSVCLLLEGVTMRLAPTWPSLPLYQAMTALASVFNFAIMSGMVTTFYCLHTLVHTA